MTAFAPPPDLANFYLNSMGRPRMELEGRTRRHANRSGRRIAIAPTPFNKVGETALTPLPLRVDFDTFQLRRVARQTKDAAQARLLLALASVYEGVNATPEALILGAIGLGPYQQAAL